MARGRVQFLSRDEILRTDETSVRILEEVGVDVLSPSARELLLESGATISKTNDRILIPEEIVKSALSMAPKSIVLAGRNGAKDLRIPSEGGTYVANGGEGVFVKDLVTGEKRPSTGDDLRDFAILVEASPQVDFCWMMVGALDKPAHLKNLIELKTCLEATRKHVQTMAASAQDARNMIKLASILSEGSQEAPKRTIFSAVQCPISPLRFERGIVEAQIEFARSGIPVVSMVASVAGLTSPVTLSGTLAQVNAENLASLVISQTAHKGAPWIYSSDSAAGNLRTGSIHYGAFETQLLRAGAGQLGRYYGVPTMVAGISLEGTSLTLSTVQQGVPLMAIQALVDSDLGSGFGGIEQAAGASFEQFLVDAWVWEAARGFAREFDFDKDAISYETIKDAGLDGNFLGKRHTIARFRTEAMATIDRDAVLAGEPATGSPGDLIKKAHREARRILSKPTTLAASPEEIEEMNALVKKLNRAG